jgi:Protein of unknown function (DUF4254)
VPRNSHIKTLCCHLPHAKLASFSLWRRCVILPFQASEITHLHSTCLILWEDQGVTLQQHPFLGLVEQNHAFNYQLWKAEDRARRGDIEEVYRAKREIDRCNQERNNRVEAMDDWLYQTLKPAPPTQCPVHSETPGMIIDRLSILALKIYHMNLQTKRQEVDEHHRQTCQHKGQLLRAQHHQLSDCLQALFAEIQAGTRTFRRYYQFKMYNDPTLNPELYN